MEELSAAGEVLGQIYPELYKCMGCNTCTRSCPMDIKVMEYISAAIRGDLEKVSEISFDCIMCGLCAARCPAELVQYNIGILARRLVGRHGRPRAEHLQETKKKIEAGRFEPGLDKLMGLERDELMRVYSAREMEPQEADEDWRPKTDEGL